MIDYPFTEDELKHIREGRLELINVRPLHARIAAALYDFGLFIWELCSLPRQLIESRFKPSVK